MIDIHITKVRYEVDNRLKSEDVDIRFDNMNQLEQYRDKLLKVFNNIFFNYNYEDFNT